MSAGTGAISRGLQVGRGVHKAAPQKASRQLSLGGSRETELWEAWQWRGSGAATLRQDAPHPLGISVTSLCACEISLQGRDMGKSN